MQLTDGLWFVRETARIVLGLTKKSVEEWKKDRLPPCRRRKHVVGCAVQPCVGSTHHYRPDATKAFQRLHHVERGLALWGVNCNYVWSTPSELLAQRRDLRGFDECALRRTDFVLQRSGVIKLQLQRFLSRQLLFLEGQGR